jgi:hypothetical protein
MEGAVGALNHATLLRQQVPDCLCGRSGVG